MADVSPAGDWLLHISSQNGGLDIWSAQNRPPFAATPPLATPASELYPQISPDGRWIAYQSEESGRDEIYVRPFPNVGQARWQVSTSGGAVPRWSKNGRELYFMALESAGTASRATLTAVPVVAGASFSAGAAVTIATFPSSVRGFDVAPDGRFLTVSAATSTGAAGSPRQRIVVVQHWLDAVRRQLAK